MKLTGEKIFLRAIEPADIDLLYNWENDTNNWVVSNTQAPFSRFVLEQYIASAHSDIYSIKQLRLIICKNDNTAIGAIDLYEFDPNNHRCGVGILIADINNRRSGYADEALKLLAEYSFGTLDLNQLYCGITTDNEASIALFKKQGFIETGIKKSWVRVKGEYKDELFLQLFNTVI